MDEYNVVNKSSYSGVLVGLAIFVLAIIIAAWVLFYQPAPAAAPSQTNINVPAQQQPVVEVPRQIDINVTAVLPTAIPPKTAVPAVSPVR